MNIAESKRERTGIKSSFTMTARIEREVNGGAQVIRGQRTAASEKVQEAL